MEKINLQYEQDDKAFSDKRSDINYRPTVKEELSGIDGSYGHVPFEIAMKTPDKRHFVNYGRHNELVNDINFRKVQESKPRHEREYKSRFQKMDNWERPNDFYLSKSVDRLKKASYIGAKLLTRESTQRLAEHNAVIEDAYRVGTLLNDYAYSEASVEDKNREAGLELGTLVNKDSIDFSRLVKKNIDESASIFDKLDLVRDRAYEFAGLDSRQYIKKNDTSTIVLGNSSNYIPEWYEKGMGAGGGVTMHTPSAFKLSVMEADKSGKDKMVIDVYRFDEFQNYYYPVSKTTLLENDAATVERYDGKTAQYSAPEKLIKDEVQSMYSHLILGDNILA